jgi:hypothetical protein
MGMGVGQLRRTGVACHIPVTTAGRAGAAALWSSLRRGAGFRTRAVVSCMRGVSGVVSDLKAPSETLVCFLSRGISITNFNGEQEFI